MNKTLSLSHVNQGKPIIIHYEIYRFIEEVLINKEYESLLFNTSIFQKDNLRVIDLGCNIGTFSLYIYDKSSIIYAIDLGKRNIELLNTTIKENNFIKIKTFQLAIAGNNRIVKLRHDIEETAGGNSIYGDGQEIETTTLEQFFIQNNIDHIDLLKIDVETAEKEIIDSEGFKHIKDKIHYILGENHGHTDLSEILHRLGFSYGLSGPLFLAENIHYVEN